MPVVVVEASAVALPPDVRDWAVEGEPFAPEADEIDDLFDRLRRCGTNTGAIDPATAFETVRRVRIGAGEVVIEPGTAASAVLVPLGPGLEVVSTGGYGHRIVPPFVPVGVSGVVRGGERNALVRATTTVEVVAVPADTYLREWFRPYEVHELPDAAKEWGR